MRIAIIYESNTGNTQKIAEAIQNSLDDSCIMCNIDKDKVPEADFYFIGFGIHHYSCSMKMVETFEKIENAEYALFMTCGLIPAERYKEKILKNLDVWLPEKAKYVDAFLCQGKVDPLIQEEIVKGNPDSEGMFRDMFNEGLNHPNYDDLLAAGTFAKDTMLNYR